MAQQAAGAQEPESETSELKFDPMSRSGLGQVAEPEGRSIVRLRHDPVNEFVLVTHREGLVHADRLALLVT